MFATKQNTISSSPSKTTSKNEDYFDSSLNSVQKTSTETRKPVLVEGKCPLYIVKLEFKFKTFIQFTINARYGTKE